VTGLIVTDSLFFEIGLESIRIRYRRMGITESNVPNRSDSKSPRVVMRACRMRSGA